LASENGLRPRIVALGMTWTPAAAKAPAWRAARASVASATATLRFASAAASASAGNRCPPVPPAATRMLANAGRSAAAGTESVLAVMACC